MADDEIVIVSCARTPIGAFQGELSAVTAPQLGSAAIAAALKRASLDPSLVDETIMGCVLPAGLGQAPARQAALGAGIPDSSAATTINKMCGSGMKAVMLAADAITAGNAGVIVAGGLESMTNAPYLLPKAREGMRLGHGKVYDHMFLDGLEDAYNPGQLMGVFAEQCAEKYGFSREAQDEYAIESLKRAKDAQDKHLFDSEMAPVSFQTRKGEVTVTLDETPRIAQLDKIPQLKPAFKKDGTVTAANASSISDGAAALILMKATKAQALGIQPIAKIIAQSTHSQAPEWFTTAPITAIQKVLKKSKWSTNDVGLFEINEAFATVAMAAIQELNLDHSKVNIYGGACALGHPVGASGARIIVTLINALQKTKQQKGVASLCIGGGEATALAIELV